MKSIKAFLLLSLLATSSAIMATPVSQTFVSGTGTTTWNVDPLTAFDTYTLGGQINANGSFTEIFNFTLPGSVSEFVSFTMNAKKFSDLAYSFTNSGTTTGFDDGDAISTTLAAGPTTVTVTGIAKGVNSAKTSSFANYGFTMNISPVPEPEEWAMMAVGLLLVGVRLANAKKAIAPLSLSVA
jgi:hypothetical protein